MLRVFRCTNARFASTSQGNFLARTQIQRVDSKKPLFVVENNTEITYGRFLHRTGQFAAALNQKYKVQKGDRVLGRTSKSIDAVALYIACVQLGAIYVPLNPAYTVEETAHYIQDSEPNVFITCNDAMDSQFSDRVTHVIPEGKFGKDSSNITSVTDIEHVKDSDVACICYTSGTTGKPKGAMLTHGSLASNATALVDLWRFTEKDRLLHMLPFYHVHGMFISLNCSLFSHSTVIWKSRFDPSNCIRSLADSTVMMGVPTFYSRLLDHPEFDRQLASRIRLFVSGSAPLSLATWEQFHDRTGHRILERYGMTEAQVICSNLYDQNGRVPGSVGRPLPGTELRLNESGVIEIRSDSVFGGYWRNPEKTKQEFTDDQFFITGDVGEIDEKGFVRIMGRSKDLVITGGLNVYPKEIEDIVDKLDGVKESAIVGLAHRDFGEAVVAVIASEPGVVLREGEIIAVLKERLAGYKVPKRVLFVDSLPRNSMAKVQKNVLRAKYAKLFA